jgi:pimeloyl-ACP methyl ester carboxylesterase
MQQISGAIKNRSGTELLYDIVFSADKANQPIFLFLHGFKAYRKWGFYPYLCEKVAQSGAISIRFDFSHAGIVDGERLIYDSERFALNTVSQEVADAEDFIDAILRQELNLKFDLWNGNIVLCGHSRGAAVSLLVAMHTKSIEKLVLISPISQFDRYSERQKELWKKQGYVEFKLVHSQQKLRMNYTYLQDLLDNSEKYDLRKIISQIDKPIMIIHGKQDLTVSIKEAYELAHFAPRKENLRFVAIEKAGHGFAAHHPFRNSNEMLDELVSETIKFIHENE